MTYEPHVIVLADFASEEEYQKIKGPHGTAAKDLSAHRELIKAAKTAMEGEGHTVKVVTCDIAGYTDFCRMNKALNTPQTVAAYVVKKSEGSLEVVEPGLRHQNITIHTIPKVLYGVFDEDDGEIYAVYSTPEECAGLPSVEMVRNFTWEPSDWTDKETGEGYIAVDTLAEAFCDLCRRTGMKKGALAKMCGKTPATFSRYCSGICPVPRLVWDKVKEFVK
jgi:hypothetical protein